MKEQAQRAKVQAEADKASEEKKQEVRVVLVACCTLVASRRCGGLFFLIVVLCFMFMRDFGRTSVLSINAFYQFVLLDAREELKNSLFSAVLHPAVCLRGFTYDSYHCHVRVFTAIANSQIIPYAFITLADGAGVRITRYPLACTASRFPPTF